MDCIVSDSISQEINAELYSNKCVIFPYIGEVYHNISIPQGIWKFELWGAASGYTIYPTTKHTPDIGLGAYVSGIINLKKNVIWYGYVGGQGKNGSNVKNSERGAEGGIGGYNGGGQGGSDYTNNDCSASGGGGATDMRITPNNLYSRIIVAGGGGSPGCNKYEGYSAGGSGGKIYGENGFEGQSGIPGGNGGDFTIELFGNGEDGDNGDEGGGAGGGGYFGGHAGTPRTTQKKVGSGGGGGGSSYVSGCISCKTLDENNNYVGSIHPSRYYFHNIEMRSGNESIVPFGGDLVSYPPHTTNGCIKITKIDINQSCSLCKRQSDILVYIIVILFIK